MSTRTTTPGKALRDVVADARILMDATADVTGDKVAKARKRLAAALERGQSEGEALMDNSADMVKDTVGEIHKLLASALEMGMEKCGGVRDTMVEKAKAADTVVRENPYRAIGIALGVGTLVGYITSCRHGRKDN